MEVESMSDTVTTALNTAFTGVKTDYLTIIEKALPAAIAILSISLAIKLGIKFFKNIASK